MRDVSGGAKLMWIGHASFLGQLGRCRFLIDPVFSRRAGWLYPRHVPPPFTPDELPPVNVVLITHNHFDHLDAAFLSRSPADLPVVVPAGLGRVLRRRLRDRVIELEWWQTARVGELEVTLVPSRHWSRRGVFDINRTLWGGYVLEGAGRAMYHAGDSAWFDGFAAIGNRASSLLVAMLPIGGYDPGWFMESHHMTPEQAGRAFLDLGASHLVPMHWGVFRLSDEPLREPARRMEAWWHREMTRASDRKLCLMAIGETLVLDDG